MALDTTIAGSASDSYATFAEYQAYILAQFGVDLTAAETAETLNMRRATAYIDRNYTFIGYRTLIDQAREWPRYVDEYVHGYQVLSTTIPTDIHNAQMELAYAISTGVAVFETVTTGGIVSTSVKAGTVESSTEYNDSTTRTLPRITVIEGLLAPYITSDITSTSGNAKLVRG